MRDHSRFLPRRIYIVYNLLLVLIPIVILILLFLFSMQKQLMGEIVKMRTVDLERTRDAVDERLESFGSMMVYASLDNDLRPFQLRQNSYDTVTALNHLKQHASTLGDTQIFFYILADECFYSPNGKMSLSTFKKEYLFEGGWSADDFLDMLNAPAPYGASPAGCTLMGAHPGGRRYVTVVYPWATKGVIYGAGVGLFPTEWFKTRLLADEDAPSMILDADGNILFAASGSAGDEFQTAALSVGEGDASVGGDSWRLISVKSRLNGWEYLSAVSYASMRDMMLGGHAWLFASILAATLACVAVGVMVAIRYYWPVRSLGALLGSDKAQEHLVHDHVTSILEDNRAMQLANEGMRRALDEKRDTLCRETLARILLGDAGEDTLRKWLERGRLSLKGEYHAVMAVGFGGQISSKAIDGAIMSLYDEGIYATEGYRAGVIAALYDGDGGEGFADRQAEKILALLQRPEYPPVRIGVGQTCSQLGDLRRSLIEAAAALRSNAEESIVYFENMPEMKLEYYDKTVVGQRIMLAETIRQADPAATDDACSALSDQLEALYRRTDEVAYRFIVNGILNDLLPVFEEAGTTDISWKINLAVHSLKPQDFMQHLRPLCVQSAQNISQKRSTWRNRRMDDVLGYIDRHFTDHELSQTLIAEKFDLTPVSLSRMFSESVGVLFMDYVSQKRLARAAELLVRTDECVREIVNQIGYIDVSSFTRKFTRFYGLSPAAYRKQKREQAE